MARQYRAFTLEFVRYMDVHGWPKAESFLHWFRATTRGMKGEKYTTLKRGDAVDERCVMGLVRFLLDRAQWDPRPHYATAFLEYLALRGLPDPAVPRVQDVLACVCDPPCDRPVHRSTADDLLQRGVDALGELLNTKRLLARSVRACRSESEVEDAIAWILVVLGRLLPSSQADDDPTAAVAAAERFLRVTLAAYCRSAVAWWRFNPWTVCLAQGNKRPIGATIVLPLSEGAYRALLNGRQTSYETTVDQLETPSSTLLIEAAVERPDDMGAESLGMLHVSRALLSALVAQTGIFSRQVPRRHAGSLRLVSFAGTPTNQKRLKGFGLKPTGRYMPGSNVEYFEKSISLGRLSKDTLLVLLMRHLGSILDSADAMDVEP